MITVKIEAPEKLFDLESLEAKLLGVVDKINDSSHKDFEATVKTFFEKPEFKVRRAGKEEGVISASVSTDNENYRRLNFGTERHLVGWRHLIRWKGYTGYMSFYPGYISKTQPGVLSSREGRYVGTRQRAKGPWWVEGIEAREFDRFIAEDHEQIFFEDVNKAFDETLAKK